MTPIRIYPWMIAAGLTGTALLIFAVIAESENGFNGGTERLAKLTGCQRRSACYTICKLISKGFIERTVSSNGRKPCTYRAKINEYTAPSKTGEYDAWSSAWAEAAI